MSTEKNQNRLQVALNALVKGYLNDNLVPGNPCKCFCGNWYGADGWWQAVLRHRDDISDIFPDHTRDVKKKLQYTIEEISEVERIFELEALKILKAHGLGRGSKPEYYKSFKNEIDLFPAVKACFNYLVSLEDDQEEAQKMVEEALSAIF